MKRFFRIMTAASVLVLAVVLFTGCSMFGRDEGSTAVMKLSDYYNVPAGEAMVIIDETIYEKNALYVDGMAYLDLDTVLSMYSHRFFKVQDENLIIYTTPDEIYDFTPNQKEYYVNDELYSTNVPIVKKVGETYYIAIAFLEQCGITYAVYEDPARIIITYSEEPYLCMNAVRQTPIRSGKDLQSDRLFELAEGDWVRVIDGGGIRENGFIKVQSKNGVRGYVFQEDLSESYYAEPKFAAFEPKEYTHKEIPGNVYLGWELMYTQDNVDILKNHLESSPVINVVAPTWYYLTDTQGNMKSYANKDYVSYAHDRGVSVWATVKNDTIEDTFACTDDSHALLSSTSNRRNLINSLISEAEQYGFDGINIDFEMLKLDSGIYYVQFLRELSVRCRLKGIILSADDYVPEAYNAYYDIKEQGAILDYVVIMGYDQHYAGSDEIGSVSSLDWFVGAINKTLDMAPAKRVIMGVPFYSRLWRTDTDGKIGVESTPNMREMKELASGKDLTWKEEAGQYTAEWTKKSIFYKIWFEEEESLKRKVDAAREASLAGIAAWKLGDESSGTWDLIKEYFENDHSAECALPPEADEEE